MSRTAMKMFSEASVSIREKITLEKHDKPESFQKLKDHLESIEESRENMKSIYKKELKVAQEARQMATSGAAVSTAFLDYCTALRQHEPDKAELATSLYTASEVQNEVDARLARLADGLEERVALQIKEFVKSDLRTARYSTKLYEKSRIAAEAADERARKRTAPNGPQSRESVEYRETFEDISAQTLLLMTDTRQRAVYVTMQRVCDMWDAYTEFFAAGQQALEKLRPAVERHRAAAAALREQHGVETRGVRCVQQYFGFPLKALLQREGRDASQMPAVLEQALGALSAHAGVEGIFRISAVKGEFKEVQRQIELGIAINWPEVDPHVTAAVVKSFLRDLPEPLLTQGLCSQWVAACKPDLPADERVTKLKNLVSVLPQAHLAILKSLLALCVKISAQPSSKMSPTTLGTCLGPNLLSCSESAAGATISWSEVTMAAPGVACALIENFFTLFPDVDTEPVLQPPPAAPAPVPSAEALSSPQRPPTLGGVAATSSATPSEVQSPRGGWMIGKGRVGRFSAAAPLAPLSAPAAQVQPALESHSPEHVKTPPNPQLESVADHLSGAASNFSANVLPKTPPQMSPTASRRSPPPPVPTAAKPPVPTSPPPVLPLSPPPVPSYPKPALKQQISPDLPTKPWAPESSGSPGIQRMAQPSMAEKRMSRMSQKSPINTSSDFDIDAALEEIMEGKP